MNFLKRIFPVIIVSLVVLAPVFVFAQGGGEMTIDAPIKAGTKIDNPISSNDIAEFVKNVLENVIKLAIPVVALAIIYSGFLFVMAQGNSEKIGAAKDALLYTVIGAAVLLGSWAIAKMISETVLKL